MESQVQFCAGSDAITFCPIDLTWTSWTSWTACSATCGHDAVRKRSRTCINGQFGGSQCQESHENGLANCNLEVRVKIASYIFFRHVSLILLTFYDRNVKKIAKLVNGVIGQIAAQPVQIMIATTIQLELDKNQYSNTRTPREHLAPH